MMRRLLQRGRRARSLLSHRLRSPGGAVAAALAVLLVACAPSPDYDLARTHARTEGREIPPLVVVPGIMASRLVDLESGEEVWPGSLLDLALGNAAAFAPLALPPGGRDDLAPQGLVLSTLGEDYYRRLVRTLEEAGGYDCVLAEEATADSDCLLMTWDWRRDLVEAAAELDALIERVRRLRGRPDLQVDLLGHSAGGLAIRYFVRHGGEDVLDAPEGPAPGRGAGKVNRALLLGVPNFGSIHGLQQMLRGHTVGLVHIRPELMATMPSLFQLLPDPERGWMIDERGRRLDRDLYDPETWRRYRWSIYAPGVRERVEGDELAGGAWTFAQLERAFARNLRRAKAFKRALAAPMEGPAPRYIVFGGDCILTPALCLLETVDGEAVVRLAPDEVENRQPGVDYERLMLEPGDGKVTRSSLLARDRLDPDPRASFPIASAIFVCEPHAELPGNVTFEDNLLNQLLLPWVPPLPADRR